MVGKEKGGTVPKTHSVFIPKNEPVFSEPRPSIHFPGFALHRK